MMTVNVQGTRRLVEMAGGAVSRWIQLSSIGVYGFRHEGEIDETCEAAPANEYERSKFESDRVVAAAGERGAFKYAILRPSNVFGEGMTARGLGQLVATIHGGLFFFLGPPGAIANYIHVENVAAALEQLALAESVAGVFNLSDDCPFEALVASICDGLGMDPPKLRLPVAPVNLLASLLGRFPRFPLSRSKVAVLTRRVHFPTKRIERTGYRHEIPVDLGMRRYATAWKNAPRT